MTTVTIEKKVRKLWGMPSWAFWVIALVISGAIGNIPYVGTQFMLVVLIVAFVLWIRQPRELHTRVVHLPESGLFVTGNRQEVVGESHYQDQLEGFVARNGRKAYAVLIPEPKNPYSPSGSAVRIDLFNGHDVVTCGYLPEYIAPRVAPNAKIASKWKHPYVVEADIRGGWESAPNYGVWLVEPGTTPAPRKKSGPRFEPVEEIDREEVKEFWSKQTPPHGTN